MLICGLSSHQSFPTTTTPAGHGGPAASLYVKEQLPKNILSHDKFSEDVFKAIGAFQGAGGRSGDVSEWLDAFGHNPCLLRHLIAEEGFLKTDQDYLSSAENAENDDGTTAVRGAWWFGGCFGGGDNGKNYLCSIFVSRTACPLLCRSYFRLWWATDCSRRTWAIRGR